MNDLRNPVVEIDDSLDQYSGKIHFPKKLALANEILAKAGMPKEYTINNDIDTTIHFPKKVEKAKETLIRAGMPEEYYKNRTPIFKEEDLTPLQAELLRCYAFNPSEDQMVKLKAFLEQLFPNKIEELQSA